MNSNVKVGDASGKQSKSNIYDMEWDRLNRDQESIDKNNIQKHKIVTIIYYFVYLKCKS